MSNSDRSPKTHTLWVRYPHEMNLDPQNRCYNGAYPKSKIVWTEWKDLFDSSNLEDLKMTKEDFQSINPGREYLITKVGENPNEQS